MLQNIWFTAPMILAAIVAICLALIIMWSVCTGVYLMFNPSQYPRW
jgi:hypothetical protein